VTSSNLGATRSPTLERIEGVVRALLNDDDIFLTPATRPGDVPGWDSFANVNIVFAVEEEFEIRFGDDDLTAVDTVGELADRVDRAVARDHQS
jgi:acyl carrier protein